jgi:hypothetical protein
LREKSGGYAAWQLCKSQLYWCSALAGRSAASSFSNLIRLRKKFMSASLPARPERCLALQQEGRDALLLDLDQPNTFAAALRGVDHRVFLLTGYTVAMLVQSKTFVDAAKKARVQHIVHLGVFGHWDCTDPTSHDISLLRPTSKQAASLGLTSIRICSWSSYPDS